MQFLRLTNKLIDLEIVQFDFILFIHEVLAHFVETIDHVD
jgi:hypothetical protein